MLDPWSFRCSAQSCWSNPSRVDLRRTASRHALQIRACDRPWPSGYSPASGATHAHADPELFAQGNAYEPFRELAAGSTRQLARALRLPREGDRTEDRGRLHGRDDCSQSVRLFCRALRQFVSVSISRWVESGAWSLPRGAAARAPGPILLEASSARG